VGARILVVEDNADVHLGLALRLKSAGHKVLSAMNGAEVVPVAVRERPDVILLDIGLPDRSGHLVAKELAANEATRPIPIIYLTARQETDNRLRAAEAGAAAYLVKPCSPERLLKAIDSVINPQESSNNG